jgi:hypothetical protein
VIVRELLVDVARGLDVRVLLWAGAPVPVIRPDRGDVRRDRDALMSGSRVRVGSIGVSISFTAITKRSW